MFRSTRSVPDRKDPVAGLPRRHDDLLDVLEAGVVLVGPDGIVDIANLAASRLLSVPAEELRGKPPGAWIEALEDGQAEGTGFASGAPARRLRMRRRTIDSHAQGEFVILIDPAEPTPSDALRRLRSLEDSLRELSVISHNINNPLTALLGRAQILKATAKGDPHVEKAAHVIEESAARIAELARELSRTLRDCRREAVDSIVAAEGNEVVGAARD